MEFYYLFVNEKANFGELDYSNYPVDESYVKYYAAVKEFVERRGNKISGPAFVTLPEFSFSFLTGDKLQDYLNHIQKLLKGIETDVLIGLSAITTNTINRKMSDASQVDGYLRDSAPFTCLVAKDGSTFTHKRNYLDLAPYLMRYHDMGGFLTHEEVEKKLEEIWGGRKKSHWNPAKGKIEANGIKREVFAVGCADIIDQLPHAKQGNIYLVPSIDLGHEPDGARKNIIAAARKRGVVVSIADPNAESMGTLAAGIGHEIRKVSFPNDYTLFRAGF